MSKKVEMKTRILKTNEDWAGRNREVLAGKGVKALNLMSSPGSGKTTILERTVESLRDEIRLGVIEGDLQTELDAERIRRLGIPVYQIETGGGCHLDAEMVARAMEQLPLEEIDLLFIENVGNLVCPAEFDLGEDLKVMVASVTEGHDKPAKYPLMFREASVILVNKMDLVSATDFDMEAFARDVAKINPKAEVFWVSAKTGAGFEEWCEWLKGYVKGKP